MILEANHDVEMLHNGPYPWPVKQRIKSRLGHLSNEQAAELLTQVCSETLQQVILGHVSETNNTPERAHGVFVRLFRRKAWEHIQLSISSQYEPLDLIELT
jgi:phosphoribosyl 1,2-cyclic phosphodiesterase